MGKTLCLWCPPGINIVFMNYLARTQSTDNFPNTYPVAVVEYFGKRVNSEKSTDESTLYPVFISEVAYYEKGIAMYI
jgi:hypothetical protein